MNRRIGGIHNLTIGGEKFDVIGSSSFGVEIPTIKKLDIPEGGMSVSGTFDMTITKHGERFFWWLNFGTPTNKKNVSTLKSFIKRNG